MYTSKVLKRKDASSLIVAVIMAVAFVTFLSQISDGLAKILSGTSEGFGQPVGGFGLQYIYPLMLLIVELILLEISVRLVVMLRPHVVGKLK